MGDVQLPRDKACEPAENARQPMMLPEGEKSLTKAKVTFENVSNKNQNEANRMSQVLLSQPPDNLSQLQRLQWLQKRRTPGLWVQCDTCGSWRYLPHILDKYELPKKWYCKMNPDITEASCSIPEVPIQLHDEEDLIYSDYAPGSLVLARLFGWPWWPAMVDDCPETEQYYWLDGFSDIPTHYNVVFFDTEVTRAWITPKQLKPYGLNKKKLNASVKGNAAYKKRWEISISQIEDAEKLPHSERLEKYCFINRYEGPFGSPKKINKKESEKYRQRLKKKYNIDIPSESDDDNESETREETLKMNITIVGSKKVNDVNESEKTAQDLDAESNKESSLIVQVGTDKDEQPQPMETDDQPDDDMNNDSTDSVLQSKTNEGTTSIAMESDHSDDFEF